MRVKLRRPFHLTQGPITKRFRAGVNEITAAIADLPSDAEILDGEFSGKTVREIRGMKGADKKINNVDGPLTAEEVPAGTTNKKVPGTTNKEPEETLFSKGESAKTKLEP